jgi:ribosomal protein S18 acetylase RimI-like enzyme
MLMLRDMGMEFANLGVDTENLSGALRLYEGLGYEKIKTYMIYGKDLEVSR